MFWEHTPASSLTLQPSSLSALPPALQQCAAHSRCLQRVIWMLPKIVAFVLVAGRKYDFLLVRIMLLFSRGISCEEHALRSTTFFTILLFTFACHTGTHYQFLWYMARVFLPGRRQLCRLSALVQPSMYADILTQKVLV